MEKDELVVLKKSKRNEIELMQDIADQLVGWAKQAPLDDIPAFIEHRAEVMGIHANMRIVLLWLQWHKPTVARTMKNEFNQLIGWVLADFPDKSDLNEASMLGAVGSAVKLAGTLRRIAQMAKRELSEKVSTMPEDQTDSGQKVKPVQKPKAKNRPTKAEMKTRNKAVSYVAGEIKAKYDRLPTVDEIMKETGHSRQEIYATNAYKEDKIAKVSAKLTLESTGKSVTASEQFGEKSIEHSRVDRQSESERDELDALIDQQKKDDGSDFAL